MKRLSLILSLATALSLAPLAAQDVQVELQRAIQKEVATGNLKAAIADYQAIVRRAGANKAVAAQALVRMADAHRKLGQAEATRIYERVVRDYADQTEAAAHARAALAGSRVPPAVSTGLALRRVWTGDIDGLGSPSADGRVVSLTDWQTGDLAIRDLATNTTRRLTNTGGFDVSGDFAEFSVPSPDGSQVAIGWWNARGPRADTYDLRVVTPGGKPRVLHASDELEWIQPFQWTADGRALIATRKLKGERHDIVRIALADGAVRVLKSLGTDNVDRAALSPDDRFLAYAAAPGSRRNNRDIHVIDLQTNTEVPASVGPPDDGDVYWAPDGSSLIFRSDRTGSVSLWRLPMQNGRPAGAAERLSSEPTTHILGVTKGGSVFFVRRGDRRNVYLADIDEQARLKGKPALVSERYLDYNRGAVWSPDGRSVAFYSSRGSNVRGQGSSLLLIRDLQTGDHREHLLPFETPAGPATAVRWFPDGASLLVVSRQPAEGPTAAAMSLAYARYDLASGRVDVLYRQGPGRFLGNRPDLSPDGRTLFFTEGAEGGENSGSNRLIRLDLSTGRQAELKTGWIGSLAVSPDGKQIAYLGGTDRRADKYEVGVLPVEGGSPGVLFESAWDTQARLGTLGWSRDGRHLLFARRKESGAPQMLWRLPVTGGEPTPIGVEAKGQIKAPNVSPDGRRLLFTVVEGDPSELWVMENLLRSSSAKK